MLRVVPEAFFQFSGIELFSVIAPVALIAPVPTVRPTVRFATLTCLVTPL